MDELATAVNAVLLVDPREVLAHRLLAHPEHLSDLGAREPLQREERDLGLAGVRPASAKACVFFPSPASPEQMGATLIPLRSGASAPLASLANVKIEEAPRAAAGCRGLARA